MASVNDLGSLKEKEKQVSKEIEKIKDRIIKRESKKGIPYIKKYGFLQLNKVRDNDGNKQVILPKDDPEWSELDEELIFINREIRRLIQEQNNFFQHEGNPPEYPEYLQPPRLQPPDDSRPTGPAPPYS